MSSQNQNNRKNQKKPPTNRGNRKTVTENSRSKTVEAEKDSIVQEVILWVMLAVSIVLFVSNFGIGGKVGNFLSGFLVGVVGLMAYAFPVFLFV